MKIKKLLAGVLAGAMVVGSVMSASAATTISDITAGSWWIAGNFSPAVAIEDGTTTTFTFTQTTTGSNNWNSASYVLFTASAVFDGTTVPGDTADYVEYLVCRSDNYCWEPSVANGDYWINHNSGTVGEATDSADYNAGLTYTTLTYNAGDWDTFFSDLQAGAASELVITRSGTTLTCVFTVGATTTTAVCTMDTTADIYVSLLGELVNITGISYTVVETTDDEDAGNDDSDDDSDTEDTDDDADDADDTDDTTATSSTTSSSTGDSFGFVLFLAGAAICMGAYVVVRKKLA